MSASPRDDPGPARDDPARPPAGAGGPDEADLLFAFVRARYGERLDAGALDAVRQAVGAIVDQSRALRAVRLGNADEPFVTFRPDPWP
jgi:hypothetical protein